MNKTDPSPNKNGDTPVKYESKQFKDKNEEDICVI